MMECCGIGRETPYCPICGKLLFTAPIDQLAIHIQRNVSRLASRMKRRAKWAKEHSRNVVLKEIDENSLKKWTSWGKALQELRTKS